MAERYNREKTQEASEIIDALSLRFLCSVKERFELLREMGLTDQQLVHIDCEGAPLNAATNTVKFMSTWGESDVSALREALQGQQEKQLSKK